MRTHKTGCVHTTWDRHTTSRASLEARRCRLQEGAGVTGIARQLAIHAKMLHTAAGCTGVGQQETNVHTYTARDQGATLRPRVPFACLLQELRWRSTPRGLSTRACTWENEQWQGRTGNGAHRQDLAPDGHKDARLAFRVSGLDLAPDGGKNGERDDGLLVSQQHCPSQARAAWAVSALHPRVACCVWACRTSVCAPLHSPPPPHRSSHKHTQIHTRVVTHTSARHTSARPEHWSSQMRSTCVRWSVGAAAVAA